jgi:glycosyltransferase involved in cell wall biosynthesis
MSEHEGFCVPLLEAMHFGVPIVAFAAGAVPETLGGAGLLLREKRFEEVAEMMHLAVSDRAVRERMAAASRERLAHFAPQAIERELLALFERHALLPGR